MWKHRVNILFVVIILRFQLSEYQIDVFFCLFETILVMKFGWFML